MRRVVFVAWVVMCGCAELEPIRPMPPVVDPASTSAPEARYVPPPSGLERPRPALPAPRASASSDAIEERR